MARKKMAVGGVQSILNRRRNYVFDENDGADYGSNPEPTTRPRSKYLDEDFDGYLTDEESRPKGVVTIGTKTFASAFKQARTAGLDEFEWRGRRYNTKLKSESNTVTSRTVKSKNNDNVKAKATPAKLVKRNKNNNITNNTNDKQTIIKNRTKTTTAKEQSKNTTNITSRRKSVQPQQSRNQTKQNVTPSKQQSTTQSNKAQNQNSKLTRVYKDDYVYYYDKNGKFAGAFPTDNAKPKQSTSSTSQRSNNKTSTSLRTLNRPNDAVRVPYNKNNGRIVGQLPNVTVTARGKSQPKNKPVMSWRDYVDAARKDPSIKNTTGYKNARKQEFERMRDKAASPGSPRYDTRKRIRTFSTRF